MKRVFCYIFCFFLLSGVVAAQQVDVDTIRIDSLPPDTAKTDSLPSFMTIDPETGDTIITGEASRFTMQERMQQYQESQIKREPHLSFFDSLVTYFTSERLNQSQPLWHSYFKDAGDYFKFDPSYFSLDYQITPMRSTVQPYGLSGDRLNVISFGQSRRPFEHIIEPDGLMDLNDIPTAEVTDMYLLPGAAGQLFGGPTSVATLVTRTSPVTEGPAHSAFIVDKGSFAYNFVRGRFAKRFESQRQIDLAVGYRNADGSTFNRSDDTRQYLGRIFEPIKANYGLNAQMWIYDRSGPFPVRPAFGGRAMRRSRSERSAQVSGDWQNNSGTRRWEVGYHYQRQGSKMTGLYAASLNYATDGTFASHQRLIGEHMVSFDASADRTNFDVGIAKYDRISAQGSIRLIKLTDGSRYGLKLGTQWVEDFRFLPFGSATWMSETAKSFIMASVGYSERAPSLYELRLPYQRKGVYNTTVDYADSGNEFLKSEKQLVGSMMLQYGPSDTWAGLQLTGGRITDGIDWRNELRSDSADYRYFFPANGDVTFASITVQQQLHLLDFFYLRSGAAYHYVDYEMFDDRAYLPDYQAFVGGEVNFYWPQRLLHFFAYGELVYTGEYDGYITTDLAGTVVANSKLAVRLKDFTFHLIFENNFNTVYSDREGYSFTGQYFSYGFVWNFLN